jgi:XTP/dITP diphosphohydrolase
MPTMHAKPLLVLGTGNRKKAAELRELFEPLGLEVKTLADFPDALEVEETGETFAANAALKATQQARHLGRWVLGEDSGLAVDALGGAPGVLSARFSGPRATDLSNNELLLARLGDLPLEERAAHYVCHMTLSDPSGTVLAETEGRVNGRIGCEPRGTQGFGYDPLFEVVEYRRTFAELGSAVKAALSHRGRAARLLVPELSRVIASGQWAG